MAIVAKYIVKAQMMLASSPNSTDPWVYNLINSSASFSKQVLGRRCHAGCAPVTSFRDEEK